MTREELEKEIKELKERIEKLEQCKVTQFPPIQIPSFWESTYLGEVCCEGSYV